jgi:crotonobetaine/carnitine-CoA ligase
LGSILTLLDKQPPQPNDADNPLRLAYGFPTPENFRAIEQRFGIALFEWYGSSEAGIVCAEPSDGSHSEGTCGPATEGYDVRIFDTYDNELTQGETGEIVSRPLRRFGHSNGYFNNAPATVAAWRNLWYHSGDLGYFDENGALHYVGRAGESIRRRGVFISANEVEQTFRSNDKVIDAVAIGVPSEMGEDDLKVVIAVRPGSDVDHEELVQLAARRLPTTMLPRYIELVEQLPRTETGKILKSGLKEQWSTPGTFDRQTGGFLA